MTRADDDREQILKVHKDWWEANTGLRIPLMASCFPAGMNYLMFNLNGHPYFGLAEKIELWEHYQSELEIPEFPDIEIMKLDIEGDLAWLACEGVFPVREIGPSGGGTEALAVGSDVVPFRLRATEIYRRDDGEGNPVWKIWHFHCSPLPPADESRPGLGGTANERGLGWNPWGDPVRVVGT